MRRGLAGDLDLEAGIKVMLVWDSKFTGKSKILVFTCSAGPLELELAPLVSVLVYSELVPGL